MKQGGIVSETSLRALLISKYIKLMTCMCCEFYFGNRHPSKIWGLVGVYDSNGVISLSRIK